MDEFEQLCWSAPLRCTGALEDSLADGTSKSVVVALKRLGVCKGHAKARRQLARELLQIASKCSLEMEERRDGSSKENGMSLVASRVVQRLREVRIQTTLLRLLQKRVALIASGKLVLERLRERFEEEDALFEGAVPQRAFTEIIDELGLKLDKTQHRILARPFLENGKVSFQTLLAVLDPRSNTPQASAPSSSSSSSLGTPSSAFASSSSSDASSSPSSSNLFSQHSTDSNTEDILDILQSLRQMVIVAQANGVNVRESFRHFDKDADGRVSKTDFIAGLSQLGLDVPGEAGEQRTARVVLAFGAARGAASIDYGQFLRFLDCEFDENYADFRNKLRLPHEAGFADRTLADVEDEDAVPFHDVATRGPFVAGLSDAPERRANSARSADGDAASMSSSANSTDGDDDGTFVRHSYTSAGYVRQVVVTGGTKTLGGPKLEKHKMVPHGSRGGRAIKYTGVLDSAAGVAKASGAARPGTPRTPRTSLLRNATKPNSIVKYLGYAARSRNDYPRQEQTPHHLNTVLARNFTHTRKASGRSKSNSRRRAPKKVEIAQGEGKCAERKEEQEGDSGLTLKEELQFRVARLHPIYAQLERCRLVASICGASASLYKVAAKKAAQCAERLVEAELDLLLHHGASSHLTLANAIDGGTVPTGALLLQRVRAAGSLSRSGDCSGAHAVLAEVTAVNVEQVKLAANCSSKGHRQRPRVGLDIAVDVGLDLLAVREVFEHAREAAQSRPAVPLHLVAHVFSEEFYDEDMHSPLGDFAISLSAGEPELLAHLETLGVEAISWKQLLASFRAGNAYTRFVHQLRSKFADEELLTLRALFVSAKPSANADADDGENEDEGENAAGYAGSPLARVSHLAPQESLAKTSRVDALLGPLVAEWPALERELSMHAQWSFEEFLCLFLTHARDVSAAQLQDIADLALAEAALHQALRNCREKDEDEDVAAHVGLLCLRKASGYLDSAVARMLARVNFNEFHPSLIHANALLGRVRELQAVTEEKAMRDKLAEAVDRYLASSCGRAAADGIVRQMLEHGVGHNEKNNAALTARSGKLTPRTRKTSRDRDKSRASRESAQLAALGVLRRKKSSELVDKDRQRMCRDLRREATDACSKRCDLVETVFGHGSLEAAAAHASLARLLERKSQTRTSQRGGETAQEHWAVALCNLRASSHAHAPAALAAVAERLGRVLRERKCWREAGINFELAAKTLDAATGVEGAADVAVATNPASLELWRLASDCFEESPQAVAVAAQLCGASARVVEVLAAQTEQNAQGEQVWSKSAVAALVAALERHGMHLLRTQQASAARAAFRRARSLVLGGDVVGGPSAAAVTPLKRKHACRLSRLISSAATTVELVEITSPSSPKVEREESPGLAKGKSVDVVQPKMRPRSRRHAVESKTAGASDDDDDADLNDANAPWLLD